MSSRSSLTVSVCESVRAASGLVIDPSRAVPVGGGCINAAWRVESGGTPYFLKLNDARLADMFEAEAEGLAELASARAVRVPEPVCTGIGQNEAFLLMTWIDLSPAGGAAQARLGEALARQHGITAPCHGWHRDNTIGSTPQHNRRTRRWSTFLGEQRLGFQLTLAGRNGYGARLSAPGERLLAGLSALLGGDEPEPALLHGDLWGGNWGVDADGVPVIFDPAVFYGDREADMAMTELFGGFGPAFYAAYRKLWPVQDSSAVRLDLYKLYHVLNHLNLFGSGYLAQASALIEKLLGRL